MLTIWLAACISVADPPVCDDQPRLFGVPDASTGLDASACGPTCDSCGETPWSPRAFSPDELATWRGWELIDPPAPPVDDPYAGPPPAGDSDAFCAMIPEGRDRYRLATVSSALEADRAGGVLTHFGSCGVCSSLADLAVYAERPDLTGPVRQCGLDHLVAPPEQHVACLQDLGFTTPCAWIWYWNTRNTRVACAAECFAALDAPWHTPDGALNPCLQCDEDQSGPVFRAVAGRTRRNTGLPSTMCRPCTEVRPLDHHY